MGCDKCENDLKEYCVLNDYITKNVYKEIINSNDIVIASPVYMSNINAITKNLIDRMNPFYHHNLLNGKNIYLILVGQTSKKENNEEINKMIEYFNGISEWLHFNFTFLEYFEGYNNLDNDLNYNKKIINIKNKLIDDNIS